MADPAPLPTRPSGPIERPFFFMGDRVSKVGGDYRFDGEIRGVILKRSGALRYAVEDDRGVLHIFRAEQLVRREPGERSMAPIGPDARREAPSLASPYPPLSEREERWR